VIATAHDDAIPYVLQRGASTVIDYYRREKLATGVKARFPNGIDSLIDLVSRDPAKVDKLASLVRRGGSVISTLHAADIETLQSRGIHATNVSFALETELLARVTQAIEDGELPPAPVRRFPFDHVAEAFSELRAGHSHGKLVLAIA
jgi:NADPH:quinone reductase-like Zn-dependent oxidoreductase